MKKYAKTIATVREREKERELHFREHVGETSLGDLQERHKYSNIPTSNTAITLIALIITIIVLLILAGVTLSMVMGDSGIFSKANQAKEKTKNADDDEKIKLAVLASIDDSGNFNQQLFKEELKSYDLEGNYNSDTNETVIKIGEKKYKVNNKGEVTYKIINPNDKTEDLNTTNGIVAFWDLKDDLNSGISSNKTKMIDYKGTAKFEDDSVYLDGKNMIYTENTFNLQGNQTTFLQYKRTGAPTNWSHMFGYEDPCSSVYDHNSLWYDSYEGKLCLITYNNYGQHISFNLDEALPLNTWVNIIVTTDENGTIVYINNLKGNNSYKYVYEKNDRRICLGGNFLDFYFPSGYYKNFGIFNRCLSENEVKNLFN